jgi:hypothetical protein
LCISLKELLCLQSCHKKNSTLLIKTLHITSLLLPCSFILPNQREGDPKGQLPSWKCSPSPLNWITYNAPTINSLVHAASLHLNLIVNRFSICPLMFRYNASFRVPPDLQSLPPRDTLKDKQKKKDKRVYTCCCWGRA